MRQPSCTIAGLKKASLFPVTIFQRDFPVADFVQVDAGRIERAAFQIVARVCGDNYDGRFGDNFDGRRSGCGAVG